MGHTGSGVGAELSDQGCKTARETAIAEVCSMKFVNGPVRCIWETRKSCHNGVSVPTPLSPVDLWVMHRVVPGALRLPKTYWLL